MNLHHKAIVFLFMLLFASSSQLLLPTVAVPSSRSLKSISDEDISSQHLYDDHFQRNGRMVTELADYAGTGANNHHDPKPPPTS